MNGLSLCAGIGGLDLGIEIAFPEYRTIAAVEKDEAAALRFRRRFPEAKVFEDVMGFDARPLRGVVDCVVAGWPCQPHSVAGRRKGVADERWIWSDIARILDECNAPLFAGENVSGILRDAGGDSNEDYDLDEPPTDALGGMGIVLRDLASLGFVVAWGSLRASEVGAAHGRHRVFFLAAKPGVAFSGSQRSGPRRPAGARLARSFAPEQSDLAVADAAATRREESQPAGERQLAAEGSGRLHHRPERRGGELEHASSEGRRELARSAQGEDGSSRCEVDDGRSASQADQPVGADGSVADASMPERGPGAGRGDDSPQGDRRGRQQAHGGSVEPGGVLEHAIDGGLQGRRDGGAGPLSVGGEEDNRPASPQSGDDVADAHGDGLRTGGREGRLPGREPAPCGGSVADSEYEGLGLRGEAHYGDGRDASRHDADGCDPRVAHAESGEPRRDARERSAAWPGAGRGSQPVADAADHGHAGGANAGPGGAPDIERRGVRGEPCGQGGHLADADDHGRDGRSAEVQRERSEDLSGFGDGLPLREESRGLGEGVADSGGEGLQKRRDAGEEPEPSECPAALSGGHPVAHAAYEGLASAGAARGPRSEATLHLGSGGELGAPGAADQDGGRRELADSTGGNGRGRRAADDAVRAQRLVSGELDAGGHGELGAAGTVGDSSSGDGAARGSALRPGEAQRGGAGGRLHDERPVEDTGRDAGRGMHVAPDAGGDDREGTDGPPRAPGAALVYPDHGGYGALVEPRDIGASAGYGAPRAGRLELPGDPMADFAPGPSDPAWPSILYSRPHLAPALSPVAAALAIALSQGEFDLQKEIESGFRGLADGVARWLVERRPRLQCIGNGVVPLQAAAVFAVLAQRLGGLK